MTVDRERARFSTWYELFPRSWSEDPERHGTFADVTKQLEDLRTSGAIGSSLQAQLDIFAYGDKYQVLSSLGDDLKFVFITSLARAVEVAAADDERVAVAASPEAKCERCWHYRADVGAHADHPTLCGRCHSNLFGAGEVRTIA